MTHTFLSDGSTIKEDKKILGELRCQGIPPSLVAFLDSLGASISISLN